MAFRHCESYKHKCAKEIFKQWCNSSKWNLEDGIPFKNPPSKQIHWRYKSLKARTNRLDQAFLEYPVVCNEKFSSMEMNWDEEWGEWDSYVPTYDTCVKAGYIPEAVIDIVIPHKGSPEWLIEICHKHPVPDCKIQKMLKYHKPMIEIDADWILSQTGIPDSILVKRWLIW
jgi:hypothetical protein